MNSIMALSNAISGRGGRHSHSLEELFWSRVKKTRGCWEWVGNKDSEGYGRLLHRKTRNWKAHRLSLYIHKFVLDVECVVDHICRNRGCVNPAHLRQVAPSINSIENSRSASALNKQKTHCPKGHPLDGKSGPYRYCKTCDQLRNRLGDRHK